MSPWAGRSLEEGLVPLRFPRSVYVLHRSAFVVSRSGVLSSHGSRIKFHPHIYWRSNNAFLGHLKSFPHSYQSSQVIWGKGKARKIKTKMAFLFSSVSFEMVGGGTTQTRGSCHFKLNCLTGSYFGRSVKWRRFKFSHQRGKQYLGVSRKRLFFLSRAGEGSIYPAISSMQKEPEKGHKDQRGQKRGMCPHLKPQGRSTAALGTWAFWETAYWHLQTLFPSQRCLQGQS